MIIKIHASGFDEGLGRAFCLLLIVQVVSLEVVEMLEEMVVSWREVR